MVWFSLGFLSKRTGYSFRTNIDSFFAEFRLKVTGSTGRQYPQFVSSNHRLNFFDVYFLRVVGLVFTQSLNLHGVDLLRFSISPTTFLNSTYILHLKYILFDGEFCFQRISPKSRLLQQWFEGARKSHGCNRKHCIFHVKGPVLKGWSSLFSNFTFDQPRFLGADPLLSSSVTGLGSPNEAGHETFFDIEPFTGPLLLFLL